MRWGMYGREKIRKTSREDWCRECVQSFREVVCQNRGEYRGIGGMRGWTWAEVTERGESRGKGIQGLGVGVVGGV